MVSLEPARVQNGQVYEWLCQQWEECQPDASSLRPHKETVGSASALARKGVAASAAALFHGLPASLGPATRLTGGAAHRLLTESKRQRERQDSLLQQADRHLASLAEQRSKAGLKRVGGASRAYRRTSPGELGLQASRAAAGEGQSIPAGQPKQLPPAAPRRSLPSGGPPSRRSSFKGALMPGGAPTDGRALPRWAAFKPPPRASQRSPSPPRTQPASPRGVSCCHDPAPMVAPATTAAVADGEAIVAPLLSCGLLDGIPRPWGADSGQTLADDDLEHVHALFSAQAPGLHVLGVYRVENSRLAGVYEAIRVAMGAGARELDLWHGTTAPCARNIVLGGFNRAYSGRHGTRLGRGTYFSSAAEYSLRFCGQRRCPRRMMFLARVLVGSCTAGSPDLIEPPYKDAEQMVRYDTTVDDVASPSMFCIFRDFQAIPRYLVEFAGES
mmetsp:Transcript_93942/g.298209  ORF Transcript_93942/g.298209 Transcript_93942/m.298209 type:complete len:443 (+) Transcript_93942:172-1500(+)